MRKRESEKIRSGAADLMSRLNSSTGARANLPNPAELFEAVVREVGGLSELAKIIGQDIAKLKPGTPARVRLLEAVLRMQINIHDRNLVPTGTEDLENLTPEEMQAAFQYLSGAEDE